VLIDVLHCVILLGGNGGQDGNKLTQVRRAESCTPESPPCLNFTTPRMHCLSALSQPTVAINGPNTIGSQDFGFQ